jgi:hypothetical protein
VNNYITLATVAVFRVALTLDFSPARLTPANPPK